MSTTAVETMKNMIVEELKNLREGKSDAARLNAVSSGVGVWLKSVKIEIDYRRARGEKPEIPFKESEV